MKIKLIIISCITFCCFMVFSCKPGTELIEYTIEGKVDSTMNGRQAYLTDLVTNKRIDSLVVDSAKIVFKGAVDSVKFCRVSVDRISANIILENGDIKIDFQKHVGSGTPLNDELTGFRTKMDSIANIRNEVYAKMFLDGKSYNEIEPVLQDLYDNNMKPAFENVLNKTLQNNRDNIVGAIVVSEIALGASPSDLDTVFPMLSNEVRDNRIVQRTYERNETIKKTAVGQKFTDFTIEQEDGTEVSLSNYAGKGKYVLVDFWASWCGPCRAEVPNLKRLYNKYKGDKFEIVGVTVSDVLENSKRVVEEDKMDWPQILDAKDVPIKLYGISGIPHIILIDPDGTIIARNLRGEEMIERVSEELSK